jgi:2,4-dienoyl-CoA reductase-like NADH-dependent reductase (Old Yellow Enzyme family)
MEGLLLVEAFRRSTPVSKLFKESHINSLTLSNRFVRSATWEGMATDDGAVTSRLIDLMVDLAKGGVGLIISGHAYVAKEGQAGPWQLGAYKDDLLPGLSEMAKAVHDNGGKIMLQLAHAGYHASSKLTGELPVSPSAVDGIYKYPGEALTIQGIQKIVSFFAEAATRAKTAGFDGVQIHAAHGYLLSQFLSPVYNHRTDEYGGRIQNRVKVLLDVLQAIRKSVGPDFPVLIKLNCQDFYDNGLVLSDALTAGEMLAEKGIDAIELSGGLLIGKKLSPSRAGIHSPEKEAYFKNEAKTFKKMVNVPLILVGGNRSIEVAEQIISEGTADYISMCRPLIREPGLINRWKSGDLAKSGCLSDNKCFGPAMSGKGVSCVMLDQDSEGS